jgi:hypothetical protein
MVRLSGQVIVGYCCYFDAIIDWELIDGSRWGYADNVGSYYDPWVPYLCMIMLDPDK